MIGLKQEKKLASPFSYNLIYIYEIRDEAHKNCLKIGKASFYTNEKISLTDKNTDLLNLSADKRISDQTRTAGIKPYRLYTEIAEKEEIEKNGNKKLVSFLDDDVHEVLINSGIKRAKFDLDVSPREWFNVNLETAISAIKAVKEGRKSLNNDEISTEFSPLTLYPNQEEAVSKSLACFKTSNQMLWDAKMRFGKTVTALELVKRLNKKPETYGEIKKVIIATHRPEVIEQWFGDFKSIFYEKDSTWKFGSKVKGFGLQIEDLKKATDNYIAFASLQDLRGATQAGGKFIKNQEVYDIKWDLLIIDEAHEGTLTERGENVFNELIDDSKDHKTKVLRLSGTPFNIIDMYNPQKEVYSWSYIDEQENKQNWDYFKNPKNPYAKMPKMNVFTYDLGTILNNPKFLEDKMFNFGELFRVWTGKKENDIETVSKDKIGKFVNEKDVIAFLNLLSKEDESNNYPFSTKEYQNFFKHTLWMVPGVPEAKALSKLLSEHIVFGHDNFHIVNVAGDGDEIEENNEEALRKTKRALDKVKDAIKKHERTITLSCQRLTTGVTVPEWTAVFMLYGSSKVAAQRYMQTIFRVQSPANIDGKIKENCFVFEFAPDRALKVLAKTAHLSHQAGKVNSPETKKVMEKLLKFCPVIAINGSQMNYYDVPMMIKQLKSAYIDDIVDSGFENKRIYNLEQLKLENINLKDFADCTNILKGASENKRTKIVKIVENDLDKKEQQAITDIQPKSAEEKEEEKQAKNAIRILNAIMTKVPLMVYGLTLNENKEITYENFPDLIDDASWTEFMPKDATKDKFRLFKKYIDIEMFELCNEELRNQVDAFNKLSVNERIKRLTPMFLKFKNPDKETVLTPWRVVNMHMGDCIGGFNFYNEDYKTVLDEPRFIDKGAVTTQVLKNTDVKILEINSKTGLYALYLTYSLFRYRLSSPIEMRNDKQLWKETVEKNIFVVCRTKMAEAITKRTLIGDDTNTKVNIMTIDNMVEQLRKKPEDIISKILNKSEWNITEGGKMKFDAIVGNPPYQLKTAVSEEQQNAVNIYNEFVDVSKKLFPNYISMIMPSRWMTGGRGLDTFRQNMLKDKTIDVLHDFVDARECFSNVEIKGGICYFLRDINHSGKFDYFYHKVGNVIHSKRELNDMDIGSFVRDVNAQQIIKKVIGSSDFVCFEKIAGSQTPFGIVTSFSNYKKEPEGSYNVKIYGNKFVGYTDIRYVTKNIKLVDKFKVFVPKAVGEGKIENDKINAFVPDNPSICTQTYIIYGEFNTKLEAENLATYMKTKFFHFMLGQLKNTQQMAPSLFKLVPLLDFKKEWNDVLLYKKYNFTKDEIAYIENSVWNGNIKK